MSGSTFPTELRQKLYDIAERQMEVLQDRHPDVGVVIILTKKGVLACETNLSNESLQTAASMAVEIKTRRHNEQQNASGPDRPHRGARRKGGES